MMNSSTSKEMISSQGNHSPTTTQQSRSNSKFKKNIDLMLTTSSLTTSSFTNSMFHSDSMTKQMTNSNVLLTPRNIPQLKQVSSSFYQKDSTGNSSSSSSCTCENIVRKFKSLRFKTMTVLILLFLLLVALVLATLLVAFNISFLSVEQSIALEDAKRSTRALSDDLLTLSGRVFEYAAFGETVKIVNNTNSNAKQKAKEYLEYYLHCQYQLSTRVNFALIYYLNGTLLNGLGCYNGYELESIPIELQTLNNPIGKQLQNNVQLTSTRNVGFISPQQSLSQLMKNPNDTKWGIQDYFPNILLLSSMPIQDTDYLNSYGLLVFGRFETRELLSDMSDRTQLCLTVYNLNYLNDKISFLKSVKYLTDYKRIEKLNEIQLNEEIVKETKSWKQTIISTTSVKNWSNNTGQLVRVSNINELVQSQSQLNRQCEIDDEQDRMTIYQQYYDIIQNNTIIMKTDFPRDVYTLGITSFFITWGVMTFMIIILSISIIVFLEFIILRRVLKLTHSVREITINGNSQQRVPNSGNDELGILSKDVNNMLSTLDASQQLLTQDNELMQKLLEKMSLSEQKIRIIMNSIDDFILTIHSSNGKLINFNNSFESRFLSKSRNVIGDYFKNCENLEIKSGKDFNEEILEKLQELSESKTRWEVILISPLGFETPVTISVTKVNMSIDEEGTTCQVFVMIARNMIHQQELKKAVKQMETFKQNLEFERILFNPILREEFRQFCKSECSEENLNFLEDVIQYKNMRKPSDRAKKQTEIIEKYLQQDSETPINISQQHREVHVTKIVAGYGQMDLFDGLESVIKNLVIGDTFMRYSIEKEKMERRSQSVVDEEHDE